MRPASNAYTAQSRSMNGNCSDPAQLERGIAMMVSFALAASAA
jgi:hypothetical protein